MKSESEIRELYRIQLDAFRRLDNQYYANRAPSRSERVEYFKRQTLLEHLREAFYDELALIHECGRKKSELFELKVEDRIMGTHTLSSQQCLLAHDLTNHLSVISGFTQLLEELVCGQPTQEKYVQAIKDAANKMTSCLSKRVCSKRAR